MSSRALLALCCLACSAPYETGVPRALLPNARFLCSEPPTCVAEPARDYAVIDSPERVVEALRTELPDATLTHDADATLLTLGGTTISVSAASPRSCPVSSRERTLVIISRRNGATGPRLRISE